MKKVSFLLVLLIFLNSFSIAAASIGANSNIYKEKISSELLRDFSNKDYVEAIVYLNNQYNFNSSKSLSRVQFIKELKNNANITQESLINYFEEEKSNNNVLEYTPYYVVNAIYIKANERVIKQIALDKRVKMIYPNSQIEIDYPKENTLLPNDVKDNEWNIEKVQANRVWDEFGIEGEGVVVGIIDTGVHWQHDDLKENWRGYNVNDPENPNPVGNWFDAVSGKEMPYEELGSNHGTHVTGTILGQNGIGVAPKTKWIAAKAFTAQGAYKKWLLEAGQWMLAPNGDPSLAPDIINNSWSITTTAKDGIDEWYRDMVQAWRGAGILPVFASGNDTSRTGAKPGSVSVPANYPESFAVGAVDNNNLLAKFSKRGPSPYGESEIKPEIVAPGVDIVSSVAGGYSIMSGTSMATPHISGVAALLLSAKDSLKVDEIENIITSKATPLMDSTYTTTPNQGYGHGLVNAYESVKSIMESREQFKISGKILGEVQDIEEIKIIHEPNNYIFDNRPMTINARVESAIAIKNVNLYVKNNSKDNWSLISMNRVSGSPLDAVYEGVISSEFTSNEEVIYQLSAEDYNGKLVTTKAISAYKSIGIRPDEYETDFSSKPDGWIFDGDWQWGETYDLPYIYGGQTLVGTNLSGKYSRDMISTMEMPPIDLTNTDFENVVLKFDHYREFDLDDDVATIKISTDNKESWEELQSYAGQYNYYWLKFSYLEGISIDLTEYIDTPNTIYIRFELDSKDDDVQMRGWYIDNVSLVGTDTDLPKAATSLKATIHPIGVNLNWVAPISEDVVKYNIFRSIDEKQEYELIGNTVSRYYLDTQVEEGKTYYYKVSAVDIFGNESPKSLRGASIQVLDLKDTVYFSDFEEDNGGLIRGGDNNHWEWGQPRKSEPAEAYSGKNAWATNLTGKYNGENKSWIETPEMFIPADSNAYLSFNHWLNIQSFYIDGSEAKIYISQEDDGIWSQWSMIKSFRTFSTKAWQEGNTDLSPYAGKNIKIKFILESGNGSTYTGWYIDDILVYAEDKIENSNYLSRISEEKADIIFDNFKEINEDNYQIQNHDNKLIPIDAKVTIIETGYSTRTNLIDGGYELNPSMNKYGDTVTLRVEAYGYETIEEEINFELANDITKNIIMKKTLNASIIGRIIDEHSKKHLEFNTATIKVLDDNNIELGKTDDFGFFKLENLPYGKYKLSIEAAGYNSKLIEIEVNQEQVDLGFIEMSQNNNEIQEIVYDDGTMERAVVGSSTASRVAGAAIKIKAPKLGKVMGTSIYFQDESYPQPGGNRIGIAIFTTDETGMPVEMVKDGPIFFEVKRGAWNYFDLSSLDFSTDKDYFIATIQDNIYDFMPAVGVDDDTILENTSYIHLNGNFFEISNRYGTGKPGTLMIRAIMEFEAEEKAKGPELINLIPGEDLVLKQGDTLELSFNAPEGGEAYYDIHPVIRPANVNTREIEMIETEPGLYKGQWIVEEGLELQELELIFNFISKEGLESAKRADAVIKIRERTPEEIPTHIINLPSNTVIFDGIAYDMDYLETFANGQRKLIAWHNAGKEIYVKKKDGTLVNFKDEEITIELLADRIIYYSINSIVTIYTK